MHPRHLPAPHCCSYACLLHGWNILLRYRTFRLRRDLLCAVKGCLYYDTCTAYMYHSVNTLLASTCMPACRRTCADQKSRPRHWAWTWLLPDPLLWVFIWLGLAWVVQFLCTRLICNFTLWSRSRRTMHVVVTYSGLCSETAWSLENGMAGRHPFIAIYYCFSSWILLCVDGFCP